VRYYAPQALTLEKRVERISRGNVIYYLCELEGSRDLFKGYK